MAESVAAPADTSGGVAGNDPRRWWALAVIGVGQLMIVLDATIVNVALPTMQADLGFSDAQRQWAVTAYTLAFGGLLLLGGRIADYFGRRRMVLVGAVGFAVASALGGAAVNTGMLFGARAAQGVFGALLAPALLATLTVMFTEPGERGTAFGIFSAIAGAGAAIGLVLGGVLTDYLNWRWALYVNIIFAALVALGAPTLLRESVARRTASFDTAGAALATAGLVALVFGFTKAETDGWSAGITGWSFVFSAGLLIAFVWWETRVAYPLLPLRVVLDRNRAGCYLTVLTIAFCLFGMMFFLTFYLQGVSHFTPVRTGLSFLPMTASIILAAQVSARLTTRLPVRALLVPGLLLIGAGLLYLTRLQPQSSFAAGVLPAEIMLGLGMGTAMMAGISNATLGVAPTEAGIAGALVNTSQQIGGSIGTALLNTLAIGAAGGYLRAHGGDPRARAAALVHGDHIAMAAAAGVAVAVAAVIIVLVNAAPAAPRRTRRPAPVRVGAQPEGVSMAATDAPNGLVPEVAPAPPVGEPRSPGTRIVTAVRTLAGQPIPHATMCVIEPSGAQVAAARCDDSGDVSVEVEPGRYLIALSASDCAPKAAVLEVPAAGIELFATLHPVDELRGTVRDSAGPIGNALVAVVDAEGSAIAQVRTDGEGRYRITAPPDGVYTLIAVAPGCAPAAHILRRPHDPAVTDLVLGSVARVHGVVRSPSGTPVAHTPVRLEDGTGSALAEQLTAADGSFSFPGLSDGSYSVSAHGYAASSQMLSVPDPARAGVGELTADITLSHTSQI